MTHSPSSVTSSPLLQGDKICWNCKTTQSPLWRKFNPTEPDCTPALGSSILTTYLCNKCGLFYKRNKKQRPLDLDGPMVNGSGSESPSLVASPLLNSPKKKKVVSQQTKKRTQDEFLESSSPSSYESSVVPVESKKKKKKQTNALNSVMSSYSSSTTLTNTSFTPSLKETMSSRPALSRPISSSNIAEIHKAAALTIDNEDLDAILESTKKNKLSGNNGDSYLGFGSPIIQHSSSYSIVNCGQEANQANIRRASSSFKANDADTLNQILLTLEQPATPSRVTSVASQPRTSTVDAVPIPSHIIDWYNSDMPSSNQTFNGRPSFEMDIGTLAELFGEDQVGLFD
ncbi:hypothetical protein C9374_010420 [Naegleria lovaniensis]|uniref:GATA-type domain-containing protein n=1 Tax=Naegleria lovaniensis TaxID=51637 RepID=A0AA88KG83_NAELO|nr:uncharacterized protein C9374_010420 [Naegleria lovaniensis]KAG2374676.1 hypothetical protein C9374_010420 [Naegleria lovaniensis]